MTRGRKNFTARLLRLSARGQSEPDDAGRTHIVASGPRFSFSRREDERRARKCLSAKRLPPRNKILTGG